MRMKFKDVPTGCRVRFVPGPGREMFNGTKVEVDIAQKQHPLFPHVGTDFLYNIPPTQVVAVRFKSGWRVRCVLMSMSVSKWLAPKIVFIVRQVERILATPTRLLDYAAKHGLTANERTAMYEEAKPLTERMRYARLQDMYDSALNTRSEDPLNTVPQTHGLYGSGVHSVGLY